MNRLIYPDFETWLYVDTLTYAAYRDLFDKLKAQDIIRIFICPEAPLCESMLWRLRPAFDGECELFICRDLDSPVTMRERKCVQYWLESTKSCHAITDSISHNIPLMGGMIGFRSQAFRNYTGASDFNELIKNYGHRDYTVKGSDQDFLNTHIYPLFSKPGTDSIIQHYLKGMPNTWLPEYRNTVPDIKVPISEEMRESNDVCGHIGAAGYYSAAMDKFLTKYRNQFNDLREIESQYPDIFYWVRENTI